MRKIKEKNYHNTFQRENAQDKQTNTKTNVGYDNDQKIAGDNTTSNTETTTLKKR